MNGLDGPGAGPNGHDALAMSLLRLYASAYGWYDTQNHGAVDAIRPAANPIEFFLPGAGLQTIARSGVRFAAGRLGGRAGAELTAVAEARAVQAAKAATELEAKLAAEARLAAEAKVVAEVRAAAEAKALAEAQATLGGGLQAHESAGGHTILRHVGKTDAELAARLVKDTKISASSSFPDMATAERAVADVIKANQADIATWLAGTKLRMPPIKADVGYTVGRSLARGATTPVDVKSVLVILERDVTMPQGYKIITAYPKP